MNRITRREVRNGINGGATTLTFLVLINGQLVEDSFGDVELGTTQIEYVNGMDLDQNIKALSDNLLSFILYTNEPEYTINRNFVKEDNKLIVILKARHYGDYVSNGYNIMEGCPARLQQILDII